MIIELSQTYLTYFGYSRLHKEPHYYLSLRQQRCLGLIVTRMISMFLQMQEIQQLLESVWKSFCFTKITTVFKYAQTRNMFWTAILGESVYN